MIALLALGVMTTAVDAGRVSPRVRRRHDPRHPSPSRVAATQAPHKTATSMLAISSLAQSGYHFTEAQQRLADADAAMRADLTGKEEAHWWDKLLSGIEGKFHGYPTFLLETQSLGQIAKGADKCANELARMRAVQMTEEDLVATAGPLDEEEKAIHQLRPVKTTMTTRQESKTAVDTTKEHAAAVATSTRSDVDTVVRKFTLRPPQQSPNTGAPTGMTVLPSNSSATSRAKTLSEQASILDGLYQHMKSNIVHFNDREKKQKQDTQHEIDRVKVDLRRYENEAKKGNLSDLERQLLKNQTGVANDELQYWKSREDLENSHFKLNLKMTHGLMDRVKLGMKIYQQALNGQKVDMKVLRDLSSTISPRKAFAQMRASLTDFRSRMRKMTLQPRTPPRVSAL